MNTDKVDDTEDQLEWNMATSAIQTGRLLRAIGSVLSVLSVVSGVSLALVYMFAIKGDYAAPGVVMSLVGIVPAFAMGQFLSLYGTRGVLHGIQVQNSILDLDTDE
jgi:hypothetical protein